MHTHKRRLIGVLAAGACALLTVSTSAATAAPGGTVAPTRARSTLRSTRTSPARARQAPPQRADADPAAVVQRLPRQPRAAERLLGPQHRRPQARARPRDRARRPVDVTQDAGGAAYLATHLAQARKGHRNSLTVAAGDLIGASPLLSAAFHDEPTIESMNKLGLDASAVGQPRVRRGLQGAPADGQGWLHRRRRRGEQPELLPRPQVPRRGLRLPRRQREVRRHRPDDPPAVHDQERARRQDRLHRDDPGGHPGHRHRQRRRRSRVQRRGADRQRAGARAQAQGRQRDRRADPPGRHPRQADLEGPRRARSGRSTRTTTTPAPARWMGRAA